VKHVLGLTNITTIPLETEEELKKFKDVADIVIVYFGSEDDAEYKTYKKYIPENKYFYFGTVFNKKLIESTKNA